MAYNARVFRIFIASPSDVEEEREVIARIIREWNDLHSFERKVVLLPLRWETHSAPELGKRPQELINTEIVDHADMAVGVFWTRFGTPTGEFASGTIEEIERLGNAGKVVMCYFSKAKVELDNVDLDQYKKLKEFKKKTYPNGLIESYSNIVDFRDKFAKQLEIKIRSLISKDNSGESSEFTSKPNIEFEFIDPISKEIIGDKYSVKPKILSFTKKDIDSIPDFELKTKSDDDLFGHNDKFYKQYFDYIKDSWSLIPIQFSLKNTSSIAIRDIYIEFSTSSKTDFEITTETSSKPEKSRRVSFNITTGLASVIGKSRLNVIENEDSYKISLGYDALQPQRSVTIEHPLFITSHKKLELFFKADIYADCFAHPISKELTITIDPVKNNKKPLEILKELEILD